MRAAITDELTSHVPAMLQSKYACFCVKRMLKYGSHESRKAIIRSLHGKVVKLTRHSVSFCYLENEMKTECDIMLIKWVKNFLVRIIILCGKGICGKLPVIQDNNVEKTHEQMKNMDNLKCFIWCVHRT